VLAASPILPDEDGEDGSHARLEHAQENSIDAESGETSSGSRGSRSDAPEDLVHISKASFSFNSVSTHDHSSEVITDGELLHEDGTWVLPN
jgi:hypothetical protein